MKKLRYKISNLLGEVPLALLFLLALVLERVITFILMVVKFPMRFACRAKKDHDWVWHGNGGWIFPGPKYPFTCKRCGTRSTGDWDDLEKKGFKGQARMKI